MARSLFYSGTAFLLAFLALAQTVEQPQETPIKNLVLFGLLLLFVAVLLTFVVMERNIDRNLIQRGGER